MTLPVAQPSSKPRRMAALSGSVQPLPPASLEIAPEPVKQASKAHEAALARLRALQRDAREAAAAADAARALDEQAALAAVQVSKPVPKSTEPKAREAAEQATRAIPAGTEAARQTQAAFLEALREHHADMHAAAAAAIEEIGAPALAALDEIEAALVRLAMFRRLVDELGTGEYLTGLAPAFDARPPRPGREIPRAAREQIDALRAVLAVERPRRH